MKKFMFLLVCLVLVALSSSAKQTFLPFPKARDNYWRKQIPRSMRMDYIRLGRSYLDKPWVAIPDSIFAQFRKNGNRTGYEAMSFGVRRQFSCLVMAAFSLQYARDCTTLSRRKRGGEYLPTTRKRSRSEAFSL